MPGVVERLAAHRLLGGAPREELAWIGARGTLLHVDAAVLYPRPGEPHPLVVGSLENLLVILSGRLVMYRDQGAGQHKVMEWTGGDVSGYLPYSRLSVPAASEMVAAEATDVLLVNRVHFPDMIRECSWVTTTLVHVMLDRARHFRSSELQDEKMKSLGKLAAGLAHELNNPASASVRSARLLADTLRQKDAAARALRDAGLSHAQFDAIDRASEACVPAQAQTLSAIERADREDALADWLQTHGADAQAANALADTAIGIDTLDRLAAAVGAERVDAAIRWLAADCVAHAVAADIEHAAARISTVVGAVKRFTYMDRAMAPEAVVVADHVRDTIVLLRSKIGSKSLDVDVQIAADLPPARAIGGDLNQILMNVIDNALDAAPESGRVIVSAEMIHDRIVIRVVDNGPGVPADIRDRIFDPFVTSKPVGQGTGLGLDIARQLARRNDGDIEVDSTPGRTEFRVVLRVFTADST